MIEDVFEPDGVVGIEKARLGVLGPDAAYTAPTIVPAPREPGAGALAATVLDQVAGHGLAVVDLGEPLDVDTFVELGRRLGTPAAETAEAVGPYVERDVVLNLRSDQGHTEDPDLAPFATTALRLHSEGSGRPAGRRPRFVVLMCCEPGEAGAATVLVPMRAVAARLTDAQRATLSRTRYRHLAPDGPPILHEVDGRPVFSFRDFGADALSWICDDDGEESAGTVENALTELLTAMYAGDEVLGVAWRRGLLVVIDNTAFFHGRAQGSDLRRHLKRLRVH